MAKTVVKTKIYDNLNADGEGSSLRSSLDEELERFGQRLSAAMDDESAYAFAKRTGLAESLIRKYLNGKSVPGLEIASLLARSTGVSLDWLATGKGPMRLGEAQPPQERVGQEGNGDSAGGASFNRKVMEDCIAGVVTYLERNDLVLLPEKNARLVMILYDHFVKLKAKTTKDTVAEYIALWSDLTGSGKP